LDVILTDANLAGVQLSVGGNFPFINAHLAAKRTDADSKVINMVNEYNFSDIADEKYKYVVFGNSLIRYSVLESYNNHTFGVQNNSTDKPEKFIDALMETIEFIVESGATPVFINGVYDFQVQRSIGKNTIVDLSLCAFTINGDECKFDFNPWAK
jgi:hypothetical protein